MAGIGSSLLQGVRTLGVPGLGQLRGNVNLEAGTNVTLSIDPTLNAIMINAAGGPGGSGITTLTGDVTASGTGTVAASIAAGAVTTAKILDGAVTTSKIVDAAVTNAKLAGSIALSKLAIAGNPGDVVTNVGGVWSAQTPTGGSGISYTDLSWKHLKTYHAGVPMTNISVASGFAPTATQFAVPSGTIAAGNIQVGMPIAAGGMISTITAVTPNAGAGYDLIAVSGFTNSAGTATAPAIGATVTHEFAPAINQAMQDLHTAGGGTLLFGRGTYDAYAQIKQPWDTTMTSGQYGASALRLKGVGPYHYWAHTSSTAMKQNGPAVETQIILHYTSNVKDDGRILLLARGTVEIDSIGLLTASGTDTENNPIVFGTNAQVYMWHDYVSGSINPPTQTSFTLKNGLLLGILPIQDGIILGGSGYGVTGNNNSMNSWGYGITSTFSWNFFHNIRRGFVNRDGSDGVNFTMNGFGSDIGNITTPWGPTIEVGSEKGSSVNVEQTATLISNNYMENQGVSCSVLLGPNTFGASVVGNMMNDNDVQFYTKSTIPGKVSLLAQASTTSIMLSHWLPTTAWGTVGMAPVDVNIMAAEVDATKAFQDTFLERISLAGATATPNGSATASPWQGNQPVVGQDYFVLTAAAAAGATVGQGLSLVDVSANVDQGSEYFTIKAIYGSSSAFTLTPTASPSYYFIYLDHPMVQSHTNSRVTLYFGPCQYTLTTPLSKNYMFGAGFTMSASQWAGANGIVPAPTLSSTAAGSVDAGVHYYAITATSFDGVESQIGPTLMVDNTAAAAQNLIVVPPGQTTTNTRKLYRSKVGAPTVFYLVPTASLLANNNSVTITDNTADAGLGAVAPAADSGVAAGLNKQAYFSGAVGPYPVAPGTQVYVEPGTANFEVVTVLSASNYYNSTGGPGGKPTGVYIGFHANFAKAHAANVPMYFFGARTAFTSTSVINGDYVVTLDTPTGFMAQNAAVTVADDAAFTTNVEVINPIGVFSANNPYSGSFPTTLPPNTAPVNKIEAQFAKPHQDGTGTKVLYLKWDWKDPSTGVITHYTATATGATNNPTTRSYTVTCNDSTANIHIGDTLYVDSGGNFEAVTVTNVTNSGNTISTFTAVFNKKHGQASYTPYPLWVCGVRGCTTGSFTGEIPLPRMNESNVAPYMRNNPTTTARNLEAYYIMGAFAPTSNPPEYFQVDGYTPWASSTTQTAVNAGGFTILVPAADVSKFTLPSGSNYQYCVLSSNQPYGGDVAYPVPGQSTGNGREIVRVAAIDPAWVSGKSYVTGELVMYNTVRYQANQATSGTTAPSSSAAWTAVPGAFSIIQFSWPDASGGFYFSHPSGDTVDIGPFHITVRAGFARYKAGIGPIAYGFATAGVICLPGAKYNSIDTGGTAMKNIEALDYDGDNNIRTARVGWSSYPRTARFNAGLSTFVKNGPAGALTGAGSLAPTPPADTDFQDIPANATIAQDGGIFGAMYHRWRDQWEPIANTHGANVSFTGHPQITAPAVGIVAGSVQQVALQVGLAAGTATADLLALTDATNALLASFDKAGNLYPGTAGMKIGTLATQKLGFFGATPVVQQTGGTGTAAATYGANEQGMLQRAYNALRNLGLMN